MMKTVHEILARKGNETHSVSPETTIYDALKLMAERNIGAVLVLSKDKLEGIFSERDYARKVVLKGKSSRETKVGEAMTSRVAFVRPNQTVEECMAVMTEKRIRHLPVIQGDDLIGVVSIGDIVQAKISEQQFLIEQLENYITGVR
jgi:CBS domain-containing protein